MVTSVAESTDLVRRLEAIEARDTLRRLCYEYSHGFDKRDLTKFLSVWHDDAVWSMAPGQEVSGAAGIRAATEQMWTALAESHHWITNVVIDVDGDTGTGVADVSAVVRAVDGSWSQAGATYTDTYTRRDGAWRISRRDTEIHFQLPIKAD